MADELPNRQIIEFLGMGAKNYCYVHVDAETGDDIRACVKVRGFSLNYEASQLLNYESMKERILARL
jgi:hypothetical protein